MLPAHKRVKEDVMFNVSDAAQKEIAAFFNGREPQPIRVFVQTGG
jgi:Fe-S cluster assembly iron-binding protein IscA